MARKIKMTDRTLKALIPAPPGGRYEVLDTLAPTLGARVNDRGEAFFFCRLRFPGSNQTPRRSIGHYPAVSLAEAREKVAEWRRLIARGVDPFVEREKQKAAEAAKRERTFAVAAEDFIVEKLPRERKAVEVEREMRRLIALWGSRPLADISDHDIRAMVKAKARTAPGQARNDLVLAKRFFAWCIDQGVYGLTVSPAANLKPARIIGEKIARSRILTDDELRALWRAAGRMGYPHGGVYRLLVLTGLRLNEVADAAWAEIDFREGLWTIPAERMKGRNAKARAHAVPLTDEILAVLNSLPRFKGGRFLFSTTGGEKPVWISSKIKETIDQRMLRTLRALARVRSDDPAEVALPHWTNHDIRRSVRSNLARLRIPEAAAEAVLGHVRPGIVGVYDHHSYLPEKREALTTWAARLREIVEPKPPAQNVVQLHSLDTRTTAS